MKKLLYVLVLVVFSFALMSCETGSDIDLSIELTGLQGEGSVENPYEVEIERNESVSIPITHNQDDIDFDLSFSLVKKMGDMFEPLSEDDPVGVEIVSTSDESKLDLSGLIVGVHFVNITSGDLNVYVEVIVSASDTDVQSINFPFLDGEGTLDTPYVAEVAYMQSVQLSFTVSPTSAVNKNVVWDVVDINEDVVTIVEEANKVIDIENETVTRVTIMGVAELGTGYLRGTAQDDSGVVVYVQLNIVAFTPVSNIDTPRLLEGDNTDYVFRTAVGTQWDMSGDELARKDELIAGTAGPGAGQAVDDMTYWPQLYNFAFTVLPDNATDPTLLFEYSVPGIIQLNADGTWEALAAGTTIVTVKSFTNQDVLLTIEVTVEDSLYPGILMSAFNDLPVSAYSEWNFDDNPDNLRTRPLLVEWQAVQMQVNTLRGEVGIDGNQKIFYLGQPDRVYGVALESRVEEGRGDINKTTALYWNKVMIGADATTMEIVIGNNDKVHNQYRIVMVTSDGTVFTLKDWTSLETPNGSSRVNDIVIPEGVKGETVAVVIEQRLTEKDNNAELHIKGIWINQYTPVTDVSLSVSEGTYGQGASFTLTPTISPVNATDKRVTFTVSPSEQGVTVDANGNVLIATDAVIGTYMIRALSLDNTQLSADFSLTVETNVPLTTFSIVGINDQETIQATFGSIMGLDNREINLTDVPIILEFAFNDGASNQSWDASISGSSVSLSDQGVLTFLSVGQSDVTITPAGNPALAISFTVDVVAYDPLNTVVDGVQINLTEAMNKQASSNVLWNTRDTVLEDWQARNINRNHGGSKVVEFTDGDGRIVFEGHATTPNFEEPINMVWTKVFVADTIQSFSFKVRSHDDDRILESSNFRVRVVTLGDTKAVDELIGWTTVAGRWKQYEEWFDVTLDISTYQGQEILILIEQTGSLQNNGNWPRFSDSGAGSYFHFRDMALLDTAAPALDDLYHIRQAFNPNINLVGSGASVLNNPYEENVYENEQVKPFSMTYGGALNESFSLFDASPFIANSSSDIPMFYMWGLYPALNTDHENNAVTYALADDTNTVMTLTNNELTFIGRGEAELVVSYNALGSTTEKVSMTITILSVEMDKVDVTSIDLTETTGDYIQGNQFDLNPTVMPADATNPLVTFSVTPDSGVTVDANGQVTIAEDATPGNYVITITSVDDDTITAQFDLTVSEKPTFIDVSQGESFLFETTNEFELFTSSDTTRATSNYAVLNKTVDNNWNICLDGGDCDGIQAAIVLSGDDSDPTDEIANSWVSITVELGIRQVLKFVAGTDTGAAHFLVKIIEADDTETILTNQETGIWQVLPGGYNTNNLIGNYDLSPWAGQVVTVMFMYDQFETTSDRMFLDSIVFDVLDYDDVSNGASYLFATEDEFDYFVSNATTTDTSNYAVLNKTIDSNWNICLAGGDCDGIQAAVVLSGDDGGTDDADANSWISIKVQLGTNQGLNFVAGTDTGAAHFLVKVIEADGTETILTNQETGMWQVLPGGYNTDNLVGDYDLSAWDGQTVTIMFMYDQLETTSSRMFLDSIVFTKE